MKEIWKDIEGYHGIYQVSNMVNVRNVKRNDILKLSTNAGGYVQVGLRKDGKRTFFRVHRLVAQAFIPNPENKPTVDHINTIKTDNRVSNLRWMTQKEQLTENEVTKKRRKDINSKIGKQLASVGTEKSKKKVLCVTTGQVFNSTRDAVRYYNIKDKNSVSNAANPKHNQKTAGKLPDGTPLEWEYIKQDEES